jgi:hypothetical protein
MPIEEIHIIHHTHIEEIGRRFAGRITFWGEVDRQHLLPFGSPDEVRSAVRRATECLHRPGGGVIAHLELGAGAKLENVDAAYDEWLKVPLDVPGFVSAPA